VLAAEDAAVAKALDDIEAAVGAQQAAVEDATRRLEAAEAVAVTRRADAAAIGAEIDQARADLATLAVDRYIGQRADDTATALFTSSDAGDALRRTSLLEYLHGTERDTLDAMRGLEAERAAALAAADDAVASAEAGRAEVAAALAELQLRLETQATLRAELQRRIATWEAEQDELARAESELTDLIKERQLEALGVTGTDPSAASVRGFVMPTTGAVGSGFGMRLHPIYRITRPHNGLDIGGRMGDPVFASKAGTVLEAGVRGGFGNVIIVEHSGGVTTVYAHLSKIGVSRGDRVETGEAIGAVGSTGLSTGPHLHFEVRVGGVPKDPMLFLP
jgi:murein DD-endopeptidase MepM/ murein hydrolase activator NlpD